MSLARVCSVEELPANQAKRVVLEGIPIALVKDSAGDVHAIGDTCTHGDISLSEGFVEGNTLECWAHGSAFCLTTGIPQSLPAYEPVPVYEIQIQDGDIFIDPTVTKEITA